MLIRIFLLNICNDTDKKHCSNGGTEKITQHLEQYKTLLGKDCEVEKMMEFFKETEIFEEI